MSLQASVRSAVASIAAAHPEMAVTVQYGTQTATGVRATMDKQTEPGMMGQAGSTSSTVRVSSAEIDEPTRGAMVRVNGTQVYVLGCRTTCGVRVLVVNDTQPVEGI